MNPSHKLLGFLSLTIFIASTGLICCTLPLVLILLGAGSVMATIASTFTWLPVISEFKFWIFLISGIMLIMADLAYHRKNKVCPADSKLARQCQTIQRWSGWMLNAGLLIWLVGFFSSYLLYPLSLI